MPTITMSGSDTLSLQNHVFQDFADATPFELSFPNDIATVKIGKNGNAIYGLNETGRMAHGILRVNRGSNDDKFMLQQLSNQQANFAGFPLLQGQYVKKLGDGQGNIASDTYILGGGVLKKPVPGKTNVEGDTEQSVAIYEVDFASAVRVIT